MARIRQVIKNYIIKSSLGFLFYIPLLALGVVLSIYATWIFIIFTLALFAMMYFSLGASFIKLCKTLAPIYNASKRNYDVTLSLIQTELQAYKAMDESTPVYNDFRPYRVNNIIRSTRLSRAGAADRTQLYALFMKLEEIALRNKPKKDIMEY